MKLAMRKRGESALDELARTVELLREMLSDRIEDVDTSAMRKRGYKYAGTLRQNVERRVRPQPRRRPPIGAMVLAGLAIGVGYLLYDRRRRDMIAGRMTQVQARARDGYQSLGVSTAVDSVMSRVGGRAPALDEGRLRTEVEQAIAGGGTAPAGLEVSVEGRTVYLRGQVDNPAFVDAAAERAHSVDGVAAVVNLTSSPTPTPTPTAPAPKPNSKH